MSARVHTPGGPHESPSAGGTRVVNFLRLTHLSVWAPYGAELPAPAKRDNEQIAGPMLVETVHGKSDPLCLFCPKYGARMARATKQALCLDGPTRLPLS